MGIDALWWAQEAERLGAGEICLNSIDADGTQTGYELELTRMISTHVHIPVIASGGAGKSEHLLDVLTQGQADAALIASMVHYGTYTIRQIKEFLRETGSKCGRPGSAIGVLAYDEVNHSPSSPPRLRTSATTPDRVRGSPLRNANPTAIRRHHRARLRQHLLPAATVWPHRLMHDSMSYCDIPSSHFKQHRLLIGYGAKDAPIP